ncbi:LYR motif-containing protein 2-like [Mytilus californianus]|uniref:LYR motif-containing protein 2-like n=1 Tax=Mytilus californianus TaxID=6549 RepID=UPI002247896B|nr:LYR motif-containing protein 2-like [Mytilus californianus]
MASKVPHMMSLSKFMLRSEVLKLYRSMLRVVRRIPDKSQQKELMEWIRHDFTANKHLEDEDAIKMMITKGKQSMRELEQSISIL